MKKVEGKLFTDPIYDGEYEVYEITDEDLNIATEFEQDVAYLYGDYVYKFIGPHNSIPKAPSGSIIMFRDRIVLKPHDDINKDYYHKDRLYVPGVKEDKAKIDFDEIFNRYNEKYDKGMNVMGNNRGLLLNSGDVFVPEILADDDPLTIMVKQMVLAKEVNLNVHRATHDPKLPTLDNLRSGLIEPSRELSFPYFLGWCSVLDVDWEFSIMDRPGAPAPMCGKRIITNYTDMGNVDEVNEEIAGILADSKNKISLVLLRADEDPLKRLIKLALLDTRINIKDYKAKGSTPNLVNNMMSTLKGKSKMSISYFINWCEILGLLAEFRIVTKDGKYSSTSGVF